MSERGNQAKAILNFQEHPDLISACIKYLDSSLSDIFDFINTAHLIEKEIKAKEPEEITTNKEVILACSKASHEVFVRAIREIAKDNEQTKDMILMLFTKSRPIFWNMAYLLKTVNGKVKIEKNMIYHIKDVVLWILSKCNHENFIHDFFNFITLINEIVINKKKTDIKDSDLIQIYSFLQAFITNLLKDNFYSTANCIIPFSGINKTLSIFSTSTQETCNTDLIHYSLLSFELLSKVDLTNLVEFISNHLPAILMYLLEIQDFKSQKQSTCTELAIDKYLISLRLIRLLCSQSSKAEVMRVFLKLNLDKIKNVFFYTLEAYLKYYFCCTSKYFEDDESIIGRALKILLDIMVTFIGSDHEDYPILFCSVVLQTNITEVLNMHPPQFQSFLLQFIEKYLKILSRKKQELSIDYIKECKLVELLFSLPLFDLNILNEQDKFGYNISCAETWNYIWKNFIYTGEQSLKLISKSLIDSIKIYNENIPHLLKLNKWIQEQALNDDLFVEISIKSGIIESIFSIIAFIKKSKMNSEYLVEYFLNVKFLLGQYKCNELANSSSLMDLIIQENYITDPDCSDLCLSCLSYILRFYNESNYLKFGNLLKDVKSVSMKIRLLCSMQSILKESSSKKAVQEGFLKTKSLTTLKEIILTSSSNEAEIIELWVNCLECVRFLIEENPVCKKSLPDFDFSKLASHLKTEEYSSIRSEIYKKSIESLLYILFETNNLGKPQLRPVKTPEVIPLIIELLTDCDDLETIQYFDYINVALEDSYNAAHFANSRTTDLLLEAFLSLKSDYLLTFTLNTLPLVICHHITPQELKNLLEMIRTLSKNKRKQMVLLNCLANGVKNSYCLTDHYKFQANHTCLSSTRYFCFRNNKSILKCEVPAGENLIPSKDFSIFFWMYPDDLSENCELFVLSSGSSSFVLSLISGDLVLQYFQEGITFTVAGNSQLLEKQWNLIGISVKSLSGLLFKNDRVEVDLITNSNKLLAKCSGKMTRLKEMFNVLCIGNSEKCIKSFKGRIISFYILKKNLSLNQFREIYFMSFQYNLNFNPEAVSTSEEIQSDKQTLKYINENLFFTWHPRSRSPEISGIEKVEVLDECERFNGVSIIEAISANGGLKIFLPIIKECADKSGIIVLLNMIADVCIAQSVEMILDKEFFGLLTFVLEESVKKPDVQLVDALFNIVGHLEWNPVNYQMSFKSLFLNKRLWKDLDVESHSRYTGVLALNVKKHFKCDVDSLYGIFDHLGAVQSDCSESFLEIWQNLIPDEIDLEMIDGILILALSMFEKNRQLLFKFIDILNHKRFAKECFDPLYYSLLFLMKNMNEGQAQACLLKFLLKLCEDYSEELSKEKKPAGVRDEYEFINSLSSSIDRYLDKNILLETFDELLIFCKKSFESTEKKKSEKFTIFYNIITRRLVHCEAKRTFLAKLEAECDKENFALGLYDRENFPSWLLSLYSLIPDSVESFSIKIFTVCAKHRNFNKLRGFLTEIPSQDKARGLTWCLSIYLSLFKVLNEQMFKSDVFESSVGRSVVIHFLDYIGVLEDLLDISCSGDCKIDLQVYIPLIEDLIETAEVLQMISSTHPPIPLLSFELLFNCLKEHPVFSLDESSVYLRDGGFLRLILKLLFIGLQEQQDIHLIGLLKYVLKGGPGNMGYLTISNEFRNRWESRFNTSSYERFTDFYMNLRERKDDTIHSVKFLTQYIIAECTEVLVQDQPNPILEFLKDFIRDTEALTEIENKTKPHDSDIDAFYRLISEFKLEVHSTARSRVAFTERNKNIYLLNSFIDLPRTDSKNFAIDLKEQIHRYKVLKDDSQELFNLLTSEGWTTKVHFFFLASTSMKLNFIHSTVRSINSQYSESRQEDSFDKIQKFIDQKQVYFRRCKNIYEQKLDRSRRMAEKTYKEFCNNYEDLKLILTGSRVGKYKLKHKLDGMGRMLFMKKAYQATEKLVFKNKKISLASPKYLKMKLLNTEEETPEDPSSGEEDSVNSYKLEDTVRVDCERIKLDSSVFGFLEFSHNYLLYISEGKEKPKDGIYFASALDFTVKVKKTEKIWKISEIVEVFPRRFIHRFTAFEIFLRDGKTYYFNLFTEELCNKALDFMKSWTQNYGRIVKEPKKMIQVYKKAWSKGQISNMEYLLVLNRLASRSFNDISQYPVFPWVLNDYRSPEIYFEDETIYRNLSRPIGAQSEEGRKEAFRKYSMFDDESLDSFHYGSHYSSAGVVLHYLVRIHPFTEMAKSLQGGIFDVADRLFYSIEAAWDSGQGTTGDVKELVPELFYLPELFLNINQEDLGIRQDSKRVNDIELPPWSQNAIDFVIKHRKALESAYVSNHLHEWIDLIFGYKQKGQFAVEALNLFSSISYEDSYKKLLKTSDLETLQGFVEQVVHFGQTPVQLLKNPHPARENNKPQFGFLERWKMIGTVLDQECCKTNGFVLSLLSNQSGLWSVRVLGCCIYLCKENTLDKPVLIKLEGVRDLKLTDWEEAVQWKYTFNQGAHLVLIKSPEQYCLWGEDLVSGFHIDNSFKIHSLKGSLLRSVHHHSGLVTCVTSTNEMLFTGSLDTSIASWTRQKDEIKPFNIYLGHSEAVRQLAVQEKYNIVLSISVNGVLLMHEVQSSRCLRKVGYQLPIRCVSVSEYGLIAVYVQREGVKVFTINETELLRNVQKSDVKFLKFSEDGEFLVVGSSSSLSLYDMLDIGKGKKLEIPFEEKQDGYEIETFVITSNRDQLVTVFNSSHDSKLWKFK